MEVGGWVQVSTGGVYVWHAPGWVREGEVRSIIDRPTVYIFILEFV